MYRFFRRNREAVKRYLLIFFLSIVSIGMVFTLAPIPTGDTRREDSNVLASVGGSSITTQDLQRTIQTRFRNTQFANDAHLIAAMAPEVLEDMVLQHALMIEAKRMGIEVSDQELQQTLQTIPWLYQNGAFIGMDRYQEVIYEQTGMPVAEFEEELRTSALLEKIRGVVTDGIEVSPQQVQAEFRRRNAKAKIEYVMFDPSQFLKAVAVTPQALEGYFKKDAARYKVAEQRQVRYVLIDLDRVRAQVKVDDDAVRQYRTQHLSDFRVPDRVKVAHILFKTTGKTPAEVATLQKTAAEVLGQIKAGANFGELAKKYSEDSTASNGGDLGWIVRGQTVKEFEDAAFSMKPGQVSDLIKTIYGIHILKVLDNQPAHLQTFEEVKDSIRSELEKQRLADAQENLANGLAGQLQANPQQFDEIARKAGFEPKESAQFKFGQPVPDLGNSDAFENLAFQLKQGEVGTPISVPKGQAIIQVVGIVPEHVPTLDEVRAQVEADYRAQQSRVLATEQAQQFAARVKTGDFQKVAKAMGLTVKESKDFTGQDSVEGLGSGSQLAAAFKLDPGQTSDALTLGMNSAVFRVESHTPANDADLAPQQDRIAEGLLTQKRNLAFELFRQNLKRQLQRSGQLRINEQAMKQFIGTFERQ